MQERLQKIISRAGISSRRAGEELILAGRVRVNGHVVVRRSTENLEHFVAPAVGDRMLFVPTADGVEAFRTVG